MQYTSEEIRITILSITFLLLFFGLSIIFLIFIFSKKSQLHQKEKEILNANFDRAILQSQLETQEDTFASLGKELHDNVGQLLNSAKLLIGVTQRKFKDAPDTLAIADETLGTAIQELRSLSKSLNKEWLAQFDFIENLKTEINRINVSDSLQIEYSPIAKLHFPVDEQIILFRIVQEALQNAIKHAIASKIRISVIENGEWLSVILEDNGKGFGEVKQTGVGLLNMQQRTKLLGGTIQWQSSNNGTTVSIQLPVKSF